jgi:hypothetical protein
VDRKLSMRKAHRRSGACGVNARERVGISLAGLAGAVATSAAGFGGRCARLNRHQARGIAASAVATSSRKHGRQQHQRWAAPRQRVGAMAFLFPLGAPGDISPVRSAQAFQLANSICGRSHVFESRSRITRRTRRRLTDWGRARCCRSRTPNRRGANGRTCGLILGRCFSLGGHPKNARLPGRCAI